MCAFPINDTHVHLYDTRHVSYGWMKDVPALGTPHLPADFRSASGAIEIDRFTFVEIVLIRSTRPCGSPR